MNSIPAAAYESESQDARRVLKPRIIAGNPKGESPFTKAPAKRGQDKQKTALSELQMTQMQSCSVSGGIKKTQEQANKILTNRRDRIAQHEQKYSAIEMKMARQDEEYAHALPGTSKDDANISDSNSGNDHQVSQISQAVKSKRSQVAEKNLSLAQQTSSTSDLQGSVTSPSGDRQPPRHKERPAFEVLKSKDGPADKDRGRASVGPKASAQRKDSPSITPSIEDPYAHVRAAQQEVRQKVANLSPVLRHRPDLRQRGASKQRPRQSHTGTLDAQAPPQGSKDRRVAYRGQASPLRSSLINVSTKKMTATLKHKKDSRSSNVVGEADQHPAMAPSTPARRNQISRTSGLEDLSEGTTAGQPL